ncbi:MAG: bifunctional phosphoribosylaminoimidazolecarboxamide formyltransferase/inosine monophosphate cyclohydrolase [Planctomycetaceae bacterium]|nr:bifunctional phosphoribosylaminoimidazolecarboxamide formyltransferase/inosine monophosphate cyclohydrolase [Planctomycetaceae bacterium]
MENITTRRALISVSDKLGLGSFARGLVAAGIEIYSTGGTRQHLEGEGIEVRDVTAYTGFPEMMDGRLKTLHPKVFGGLLCRHDRADDMQALDDHEIVTFELVVVNLYPFQATIAREGVTRDEAIEKIDIGGPSLVRAAAKNHKFVAIATHPEQYSSILEDIQEHGGTSLDLRSRLAAEAFAHTAGYDRAIADYFAGESSDGPFAPAVNLTFSRKAVLRYGENPHQQAALYGEAGSRGPSLVSARQLNGKELSYNNLLDLDSAFAIARSLPDTACSVIKHNNPCGAASALTLCDAARKAMEGDPVSAFGSVLGFDDAVDVATAEYLSTPGLFVEAIVAPDFEAAAVEILTTKPKWRKNVRLMQMGHLEDAASRRQYRYIDGGVLVQDADTDRDPEDEWRVVTQQQPTDEQFAELRFGWAVCRHVKSNAIVLSKDRALCGVGAGQMSRVDSVDIAIRKADQRAVGSVLSSDAFFPFPDSIHKAAEAGVSAIIQPGGSKKDDEVIAACNELGLPMIFTGRRHFKH